MREREQPGGGRPVFAALLAGGKGTRFWPASRASRPKQFLNLLGGASLLRLTFDRFARALPRERIMVVTSPGYAARTLEELPELETENLILEPSGRDTAPAAGLAVRAARARSEDPVVIVAPTDHFIADECAFHEALARGIQAAESGSLVTFGIVPDRPATAYGYIEVDRRAEDKREALRALRFREKPDAAQAAAFLATGRCYWNAGIFAWRASVFDATLAAVAPALAAGLSTLPPDLPGWTAPAAMSHDARVPGDENGTRFPPAFVDAWEALPSISIDYALMEKAPDVRVVPLAAGWSDVGGWDAVREMLGADGAGNRAATDVVYLDARDCSVHRVDGPGKGRLYALVETEGLVVVETPDAVLICRAGAGERLREVVKRLKESGRKDLL